MGKLKSGNGKVRWSINLQTHCLDYMPSICRIYSGAVTRLDNKAVSGNLPEDRSFLLIAKAASRRQSAHIFGGGGGNRTHRPEDRLQESLRAQAAI